MYVGLISVSQTQLDVTKTKHDWRVNATVPNGTITSHEPYIEELLIASHEQTARPISAPAGALLNSLSRATQRG